MLPNPSAQISKESIKVSPDLAKQIMGINGSTMRKIKEITGVQKIVWKEEANGIELLGSKEQVRHAKKLVHEITVGIMTGIGYVTKTL